MLWREHGRAEWREVEEQRWGLATAGCRAHFRNREIADIAAAVVRRVGVQYFAITRGRAGRHANAPVVPRHRRAVHHHQQVPLACGTQIAEYGVLAIVRLDPLE